MPKTPKNTTKTKKQSIRQHVNEGDIRFELYHMKYANQLKRVQTMTSDEIQEKWDYDNQKKINRFKKDLEKPEYQDIDAQRALKANIKYLENIPAPLTEEMIQENFLIQREEYITDLKNRDNDKSLPLETQNKIKESLKYIQNLTLQAEPSKERFGIMLLLMIKNIRTMPSFSGYSDNWATDFFSNAIEKTLLYLDNFDVNLLSKRTGEKSKAFAYVTQICFNAFINIINIRKAEGEFLKDTISYETHNFDGVKNMLIQDANGSDADNDTEDYSIDINSVYTVKILKKDNLQTIKDKILKGYDMIGYINETLQQNKAIKQEIEYIAESTPENEKDEDYDDYIKDLELQYSSIADNVTKDTLFIQMPSEILISEVNEMINDEVNAPKNMNNLNLIITTKTPKEVFLKKVKKSAKSKAVNGYDYKTGLTKKQQDSLAKMEADTMEENAFNDEW